MTKFKIGLFALIQKHFPFWTRLYEVAVQSLFIHIAGIIRQQLLYIFFQVHTHCSSLYRQIYEHPFGYVDKFTA